MHRRSFLHRGTDGCGCASGGSARSSKSLCKTVRCEMDIMRRFLHQIHPAHPVQTSQEGMCATRIPVASVMASMACVRGWGPVGGSPGPRQVLARICHGGCTGRGVRPSRGSGGGIGGWMVSACRRPSPVISTPHSVEPWVAVYSAQRASCAWLAGFSPWLAIAIDARRA